jgi:hypothetical protein
MKESDGNIKKIVKRSLWDFKPHGSIDKTESNYKGDCSCGCNFFLKLRGKVGKNWGVCMNSKSHRCGLLTYKHQGCLEFVANKD